MTYANAALVNPKTSIDMPMTNLYTVEQVNAVVWQALTMLHQQQAQPQNIDNAIMNFADMTGGKKVMAKERRRVVIDYNDDGTPIHKQVQAKSEAAMNDKIVQEYINSGRIWEFLPENERGRVKTQTEFKPLVEKWMEIYKRPKLTARTYQTYEGYLKTHIFPAFGDKFVEDITAEDVQRFLNDRQHMGKKSLKNYLNLIRQIMDEAIEQKLIKDNPAKSKHIMIPSDIETPRKALTQEELKDILGQLDKMPACRERLALSILLFTGARREELLGLKWDDFDFNEDSVYIQRAVTHPGNPPMIGKTKTQNGIRKVYFGKYFKQMVFPMKTEGFALGGESPLSRKQYLTLWKHINNTVDLHGATPHVLRHTYLTRLASLKDIDPKTVQALAGHGDFQITMNTYVHETSENVKAACFEMDEMLHKLATA